MKSILQVSTFGTGSTYFQRAATFYIRELIDPTITNPHDLLTGLRINHLGQLINDYTSTYYQSPDDICNLLQKTAHPFLARLSYDHFLNLKLSQQQTDDFVDLLTEKFDIFVMQRRNLFDYCLCWILRRQTARIPEKQINNVYSIEDRRSLYENQSYIVDQAALLEQANKYCEYQKWCKRIWPYAKTIYYEDIEHDIDTVLNTLWPSTLSIKDKYGMSLNEYSKNLYMQSKNLPTFGYDFINKIGCAFSYMVNKDIMPDPLPIKSTTLADKKQLITNFDQCFELFNKWSEERQQKPIHAAHLSRLVADQQNHYQLF